MFLLSYLWLPQIQRFEMWLLKPPVPYEMRVHKSFRDPLEFKILQKETYGVLEP